MRKEVLFLLLLGFWFNSQGRVMKHADSELPHQTNSPKYAGHFIEEELRGKKELYYMRAREYDANQRRFLSPDKLLEQWGLHIC